MDDSQTVESKTVKIVAIDPGVKGAVTMVEFDMDGHPLSMRYFLMPLVDRNGDGVWKDYKEMEAWKRKNKSHKVKPFPFGAAISEHIDAFAPDLVVLERAYDGGAMRSKGASTLQHAYGGLVMSVLMLAKYSLVEVSPKQWQSVMLPKGEDTKVAAIDYCREIMGIIVPKTSDHPKAKPHDGVADAYVLACFGYNVFTQKGKSS